MLIFLGIPLAAGFLTRRIGFARKGEDWDRERFLPPIRPIALCGLLFTIVMLSAIQGDAITSEPLDVVLIAVPLLVYLMLMFFVSFWLGRALELGYARTSTPPAPRRRTTSNRPSPSASGCSARRPAKRTCRSTRSASCATRSPSASKGWSPSPTR